MPRLPIAVVPGLLAGLLAGPSAIAQDSPKADPPATAAPASPEKTGAEAEAKKAASKFDEVVTREYRRLNVAQPKAQADQEKVETERKFLENRRVINHVAVRTDPLETVFGLGLADADDALRAQLEIPHGQGVLVVSVKGGGLADQAGLRVNDIMLSLGDQPAKSAEQVRNTLLRLGGEAPQVKLIRQGKPTQLSVAGPKHGASFERFDYFIGVPVSPVDAALRAHLPSLSADSGLVANDVVEGSPAQKAGVRKNDILVALGGKALKDSAALIEQVKASEGKPVPLELLRAGKPMTIQVTPENRGGTVTFARIYNNPATVRYTYDVVRPNIAILEGKVEAAGKEEVTISTADPTDQKSKQLNLVLQTMIDGDKGQSLSDGNANSAKLLEQMKALKADLDQVVKSLEGLSKLDQMIVKDLEELLKKPAAK